MERVKPYVTEEQIRAAKAVNTLAFLLRHQPEQFKRVGRTEYAHCGHDSLKVSSNGKWNWHSKGVGGTTAPAMAAVGNGSYARAARNLTWADAYNTAGSRGYARAEVGRIINGKRVVYYNGWKHGYAYTSATTGSSWYARGLLK